MVFFSSFSRLFPQWSAAYAVFTQVELPDKIYIEYIIIFYCWQRLERDETIRQRILEFAGKFMRPSSTLLFNTAYKNFLPPYNTPRTATRCILDHLNMQRSCTGLRAASRLDNRLSQTTEFVSLSEISNFVYMIQLYGWFVKECGYFFKILFEGFGGLAMTFEILSINVIDCLFSMYQ